MDFHRRSASCLLLRHDILAIVLHCKHADLIFMPSKWPLCFLQLRDRKGEVLEDSVSSVRHLPKAICFSSWRKSNVPSKLSCSLPKCLLQVYLGRLPPLPQTASKLNSSQTPKTCETLMCQLPTCLTVSFQNLGFVAGYSARQSWGEKWSREKEGKWNEVWQYENLKRSFTLWHELQRGPERKSCPEDSCCLPNCVIHGSPKSGLRGQPLESRSAGSANHYSKGKSIDDATITKLIYLLILDDAKVLFDTTVYQTNGIK